MRNGEIIGGTAQGLSALWSGKVIGTHQEARTSHIMAISDLLNAAIDKPIATAARVARRTLERILPEKRAAAPSPAVRKSKGWRRHLRKVKAQQRDARG